MACGKSNAAERGVPLMRDNGLSTGEVMLTSAITITTAFEFSHSLARR
jgi:hypothetical protein